MKIRTFQDYIKENEENEEQKKQDEMNTKIVAFFTQDEPIDDEKIHAFAEELGIDYSELENKIYAMLKDLLMAKESGEEEIVDESTIKENENDKTKIVIDVSGGNVRNVYSDKPKNTLVSVIDRDNEDKSVEYDFPVDDLNTAEIEF
jgi:glucan biosynthesis protein